MGKRRYDVGGICEIRTYEGSHDGEWTSYVRERCALGGNTLVVHAQGEGARAREARRTKKGGDRK